MTLYSIHCHKDKWFVIACQNVRSVVSHVEDILADPIMMEADVLCLTETSIENESWPKKQNFTAFDIFTKSRRTSYDSDSRCNRKSGGVAVLIKNKYLSAVENPMKIGRWRAVEWLKRKRRIEKN